MAENTVSNLAPFGNGYELDFIEKNGEILFTSEEVGRHLGYGNPSEAINRLFQRNLNELKHYSVPVRLTATDGKTYERRAFTEEGVYILSMLARTNEAKKFRARVALLLRRIRREQAERMAELARDLGYQQGVDEARSLPALQAAGMAGYLDGLKEGQRLQKKKDSLVLARKALGYRSKGLSLRETARLLNLPRRTLEDLLTRVRSLSGVVA